MDNNTDAFFNNDLQYMKSLIGKSVEITTSDSTTHKGVVYVIDPNSKTVALIKIPNSNSDDLAFENVTKPPKGLEEVETRKLQLKMWLIDNLINVQEDGTVLKLDNATIEPPYGVEQCISSSMMVLDKIQTLIANMPMDYHQ